MPLRRTMGYMGRPMAERGPHQIAVGLSAVLEAFAAATGRPGFDVGEHEELEKALLAAGQAVYDGMTPNA